MSAATSSVSASRPAGWSVFSRWVIALLTPGQGAQTPGMLQPWLALPGAEEQIAAFSAAAGLDLRRLGTTADADEITDTRVTQPLVVATTLLAYAGLAARVELPAGLIAVGHSVGELAAAAVSGAMDPVDAVELAAIRGAEMAAACALEPTGMAAVLGGEQEQVLARLAELGLDPANRNGAGQIVAAGPLAALDELEQQPPAGARVRRLAVAGAFHTRFMAAARQAMAERAETIKVTDPRHTMLSNADGRPVDGGDEVRRRLVDQVTAPVRWDACMATMAERGVTATIELPPAGALTGMVRRAVPGVTPIAVRTPDNLDKAVELLTSHAGQAPAPALAQAQEPAGRAEGAA